ncbi:MAG: hypothetical protein C0609_09940 [Deltaproteobacteria bacterium]|nr:MAG: hypothetical protein C0609_09940 [Deltaproteobacteria bacterium]
MKILMTLAAFLAFSIWASAGETVTVSGKTIFEGMGVEEVRILAEGGGMKKEFKSTYHGTFRVELPPGVYTLKARGALPGLELAGDKSIEVKGGERRLDRVTIPLHGSK